MPAMLNMNLPLRSRLAHVKAGESYRNETWGSYTRQPDKHDVYYVENGALRGIADCHDIARIDHKGWYTDREFQDDVMVGVVYALPAKDGKRRLVAGYRYTGGDDGGATLFFDELFDDEKDAARMADEHARIAAEHECDYQDEERARIQAEEAEEARLDNLADCHPPLVLSHA